MVIIIIFIIKIIFVNLSTKLYVDKYYNIY